MTSPLANKSFRRLFAAQIFSLLGVGLLTVALSLAAFRIGGAEAGGKVLGMLLALKMVAYVVLAPLAETVLAGLPRKRAMVLLDLGRMLLLVPMAFVTEIWQVAGLAFAFFFFLLERFQIPFFNQKGGGENVAPRRELISRKKNDETNSIE